MFFKINEKSMWNNQLNKINREFYVYNVNYKYFKYIIR